jgi:hypothetical protein
VERFAVILRNDYQRPFQQIAALQPVQKAENLGIHGRDPAVVRIAEMKAPVRKPRSAKASARFPTSLRGDPALLIRRP